MNLINFDERQLVDEIVDMYRSPSWLRSRRGDDVFTAAFEGEREISVNLNVTVDGVLLTDVARSKLLSDIHDFLCIQVPENKKTPCGRICAGRIRRALHVIDYFLLRADSLGLAAEGFGGISSGHVTDLLLNLSRRAETVVSLYDWPKLVADYLRSGMSSLCDEEFVKILVENPLLIPIPAHPTTWKLGLSTQELWKARAFLWKSGLYQKYRTRRFLYEYASQAIAKSLLGNTLYGVTASRGFPLYSELCIGHQLQVGVEGLEREHVGSPVGSMREDRRCSEGSLNEYRSTLLASDLLSPLGLGIPTYSLKSARNTFPLGLQLKPHGRTAIIPAPQVAKILREAIRLFVDHGEHILASTAAVLKAAKDQGVRPTDLDSDGNLCRVLQPETHRLGIEFWAIGHGSARTDGPLGGPEYAVVLRQGKCLLQMAEVTFGAMAILVGAMTFGRRGELGDIRLSDVNSADRWVSRRIGKSGSGENRLTDAFPVPKVVIDIFTLLERFLAGSGNIGRDGPLFSVPTLHGTFDNLACRIDDAVDKFLDYVEGPLDEKGRRYYVRQHQLRAALPTLYFHSSDSPDVDVLRWALGHASRKEIWTYISSSTPPAVLQSSKAYAIANLIKGNDTTTENLARFVLQELAVQSIDIYTTDELRDHIEDLMQVGILRAEPLFSPQELGAPIRFGYTIRGEQ